MTIDYRFYHQVEDFEKDYGDWSEREPPIRRMIRETMDLIALGAKVLVFDEIEADALFLPDGMIELWKETSGTEHGDLEVRRVSGWGRSDFTYRVLLSGGESPLFVITCLHKMG